MILTVCLSVCLKNFYCEDGKIVILQKKEKSIFFLLTAMRRIIKCPKTLAILFFCYQSINQSITNVKQSQYENT